jgi:NADPH:quinone reductase
MRRKGENIPEIMKAVFLEKPGGPFIIREVPVPRPSQGEVLIKILAAPVNPSDIAGLKRISDQEVLKSVIPGLEGSGIVIASGDGLLPGILNGKRVTCSSSHNTSGTWAEFMVTKAGMCFPLGKKVSDEQGSMSLVNPLTALGFFEIVEKEKHRALINNAAASSLGRMVELIGKKRGIPVINLVRNRKQAEMLEISGSAYVLDCSDPDFLNRLRESAEKLKATILFDSVCSHLLGKMTEVLPAGSSVVIYGNLSSEESIHFSPRSLIDNDIKISGFYLGNKAKESGLIRNIINLRNVRKLMSTDLIIKLQGRFSLDRAQEAVDTYLSNMSAGKVLLVP